jgi:hypothetical protein
MFAPNHVPVLDQIEATFNELRPEKGLGPVTKVAEHNVVAVPLIASSDPVHPTLSGCVGDRWASIRVDWIVAIHTYEALGEILLHVADHPEDGLRPAGILLSLNSVLATNHRCGTSYAGLDSETGNIFVRDNFKLNRYELKGMKDRILGVIDHAKELRGIVLDLWSEGLELPDPPESPLPNGFSIN